MLNRPIIMGYKILQSLNYGIKIKIYDMPIHTIKKLNVKLFCTQIKPHWKTLTNNFLKKDNSSDESWVRRIVLQPISDEENLKLKIDSDIFNEKDIQRIGYVALYSYCGHGFKGNQVNPGEIQNSLEAKEKNLDLRTSIEERVLKAMVKSTLMEEIVFKRPQFYRFQRASRTDKNVSAVRNVFNFSLDKEVPVENFPRILNQHLPESIKVHQVLRISKNFNSKNQCDSRTYSYMCPTYAFAPIIDTIDKNYRIPTENLQDIQETFEYYLGTHKYHNFTRKVKYDERRAYRYINHIETSDPFIREGVEWIIIKIKGSSFMLYQIRKMIGLAMAVCKEIVPISIFDTVFGPDVCGVPTAPALGLMLEEPHFEGYNRKNNNWHRPKPVKWDESLTPSIEDFRDTFINPVILNAETKDCAMLRFLPHLFYNSLDIERNEKGIVMKEDRNAFHNAYSLIMGLRRQNRESQISGKED